MPTPLSLAVAAAVGMLSGAHAAIWGMYKDSIYEGFGLARFARSIIVGSVAAVFLQAVLQLALPDPAAIVVLFGLAYAAERGCVEVWKTFIRDEDQSKYFIPMAFSIGGVPVKSRLRRLAAGAGYVIVVALCLMAAAQLDRGPRTAPGLGTSALVGLMVGIIIAIGGAWKDAPKEGFQLLKFFRSPSVTVVAALALSMVTGSYLQIAVAAIGYERAAVETWKTLFARGTAPGKFSGKPERHPEMRRYRRHLIPVFIGIWAIVIACATLVMRDLASRAGASDSMVDGPK